MQVDPPEQSTEQLPSHVTWHVAPPEQSTLALGPTVIVHVDEPVHLRLHDEPHDPLHSFMLAQSRLQLFPQDELEMSQDSPDGHEHVEPVHFGGVPLLLPQPSMNANRLTTTYCIIPSSTDAGLGAATVLTYGICTADTGHGARRREQARCRR